MPGTDDSIVIANEFAHVTVRYVAGPGGQHIEISAPKRERRVELDAETLWSLAGQSTETFSALLADAPIGIRDE